MGKFDPTVCTKYAVEFHSYTTYETVFVYSYTDEISFDTDELKETFEIALAKNSDDGWEWFRCAVDDMAYCTTTDDTTDYDMVVIESYGYYCPFNYLS